MMGSTEVMGKNNCIKEKCKFYDALSECAVDGCLFGASAEDDEKERGCYMNGFTMMADSYRKMVESGRMTNDEAAQKIRIYDFLSTCSEDDFYCLFDSSAFNDIMKDYVRAALKNAELDEETVSKVMNEIRFLLSEKTAREISEE